MCGGVHSQATCAKTKAEIHNRWKVHELPQAAATWVQPSPDIQRRELHRPNQSGGCSLSVHIQNWKDERKT